MTGSRRRVARELAVRGLYSWLMSGGTVRDIADYVRSEDTDHRADDDWLERLLDDGIGHAEELDGLLAPCLDRKVDELSRVEHAILLIATVELAYRPDVPYRVVLNEAIDIAKEYGGTDGHKYVNGVLDKLARQLRPAEIRQGGSKK